MCFSAIPLNITSDFREVLSVRAQNLVESISNFVRKIFVWLWSLKVPRRFFSCFVPLLILDKTSSDSFGKGTRAILGTGSATNRGFCPSDSCHMGFSKRPSEQRKLLRNYPVVGAFSCWSLLTYICVWLTRSCHHFHICGIAQGYHLLHETLGCLIFFSKRFNS